MKRWLPGLRDIVEKLIDARVVRGKQLPVLFEDFFLKRFFKSLDVDCVFDVGANSGQYASKLRHKVGYRGPIISFEPIPELAEEIRRAASHDPHWYVEAVALDSEPHTRTFKVMEGSQFSSLLEPTTEETSAVAEGNRVIREFELTTVTLEAVFDKYQQQLGFKRPFLKMDTQGNDLEVAKGAGAKLERFVGVQSELALTKLYKGSSGFSESIAFYASHGFAISALVPNNEGHFPFLLEIDCILINTLMQTLIG